MNNFAYQCRGTNNGPIWTPCCNKSAPLPQNDERFGGGFLLPFLTGAVVSAPFWYIAGNNKYQNQQYPVYQQYYPYPNYPPYQPYPMMR